MPNFPLWEDRKCGGCGELDKTDEPAYRLTCGSCGYEGCETCMPMGRGIPCLDCENEPEDDAA